MPAIIKKTSRIIEFGKGPFKNHVDRKLEIFDPPSPHVDTFYISGHRQNQEFFDPPPPLAVYVVFEWPLTMIVHVVSPSATPEGPLLAGQGFPESRSAEAINDEIYRRVAEKE